MRLLLADEVEPDKDAPDLLARAASGSASARGELLPGDESGGHEQIAQPADPAHHALVHLARARGGQPDAGGGLAAAFVLGRGLGRRPAGRDGGPGSR